MIRRMVGAEHREGLPRRMSRRARRVIALTPLTAGPPPARRFLPAASPVSEKGRRGGCMLLSIGCSGKPDDAKGGVQQRASSLCARARK